MIITWQHYKPLFYAKISKYTVDRGLIFFMCTIWQYMTTTVIFVSIEKVLERGEKIDVLVGKTEELDHSVS